MTAEVFLDANILLYACSAASADAERQRRAEALILNESFGLSAQVLQEFIANALKKKTLGITEAGIDAMLELASYVPVLPVTLELIMAGTHLRRRHQLSHWDATIVAAAQELRCRTLYSEDLSHGRMLGQLRIINPFIA